MKCDLCKKNEATVHVKQVCEGAVKEVSVCPECAAQKGLNTPSALSLTSFLFGMGAAPEAASEGQNRKCPGCGLRASEFKKGSRMGCALCYDSFTEELAPILAGMHPGNRHVGKVPAGARAVTAMAQLQSALSAAVSAQNFEEAARLRDRITALRQTSGKDE